MKDVSLFDCLDELIKELNKEIYTRQEMKVLICSCGYITTRQIVRIQQKLIDADKKILALMEENLKLEGMM